MSEFNFKSQICTSREQSEKLLVLGLKKETADMHYYYSDKKWKIGEGCNLSACKYLYPNYYIPAWSLHRLWEIGKFMGINLSSEVAISHLYEFAIARIEQQIKEGYFNKEYLEE